MDEPTTLDYAAPDEPNVGVVLLLTVVCSVTMYVAQPGTLILITAVIGFAGTVIYSIALLILNHFVLPKQLPRFARPGKVSLAGISISCTAYLVLMAWYLWAEFVSSGPIAAAVKP